MNRAVRAALVLGGVLILAGLAVRPFAAEARALLEEPRALRFFSCLYDHGSLGRGLTGGTAHYYPSLQVSAAARSGMAEVSNVVWEECPVGWASYYFALTEEGLSAKVAAGAQSEAPPTTVRIGEGVVFGTAEDGAALREAFQAFDPATYPINPEAVRLVLLKTAASDWRHNRALSANHGLTALVLLPIDGFVSLSRLAAVPFILRGGAGTAAVLAGLWSLVPGAAFVAAGVGVWLANKRRGR